MSASRVPAWKRLGLKLNNGTGGDQSSPAAPAAASSINGSPASSAVKRKASSGAPAPDQQSAAKKTKTDSQDATTPSKKAKSVSFAAETTSSLVVAPDASGPPGKDIIRNKPKQKLPPAPATKTPAAAGAGKNTSGPAPPINLGPALEYLRKWHSERDAWKFNKNHQTKLLEQVFADETTIPAADIDIFYEYIRPLKGHVRQRLRELANGVKSRDVAQGASVFAGAGTPSKAKLKDAEKKQDEYEQVIRSYMAKDRPSPGAKPRFQEVDYVLRTADMEMQRRVVKRMRAEVVLDELADEGEGGTSGTATDGDVAKPAETTGAAEESVGTRDSLNDGSQQRVKRKRKTRTAVVEDEYDSSSSDDDSSSGDSSDDEEAGGAATKGKPKKTTAKPANDSSSSDSSDSSDSDSDSDSD
ncbi:hypothetical protein Micbo1qcDRAFT_163851 [Microdochium bolleyi]|uniref:WKF domain-containing protein n=1 Tax=Microdochium bolleyi TaxID=196109 RepID=A0A136J1L5_9PEZI|nr:hypothetical protein Micbo1qcDRAFT_163851 [Microdochium bolleyi]